MDLNEKIRDNESMQPDSLRKQCAVCYDNSAQRVCANTLAKTSGLDCIHHGAQTASQYDYLLCYQAGRLTLLSHCQPDLKPFSIDFCRGKLHYRLRHDSNPCQPLARAVGIKSGVRPAVLDITAGFGQDSSVLANLGCHVTLLERHPIVFALLNDGLIRARAANCHWCHNMRLIHQDAADYCQQLLTQNKAILPDVIYCDPMFPDINRKANVQKSMQILQTLVGKDDNNCGLFSLLAKVAQKRIVVKRPKSATPWCDRTPDFTIDMVKHRFDVYIKKDEV